MNNMTIKYGNHSSSNSEPRVMTSPKGNCIKCYKALKENEKTLCSECVSKLSKDGAVVFVIDAFMGKYSKRIEIKNGT